MPAGDFRNARLLLDMAAKDYRALCSMFEPEAFADEVFGFHCQQAAEKALKAWLSLLGVQYQRIHDLSELLSLLEDHVPVPERFADVVEYNPFGVQHRYLPFEGCLSLAERETMVELVGDLLAHVEKLSEGANGDSVRR